MCQCESRGLGKRVSSGTRKNAGLVQTWLRHASWALSSCRFSTWTRTVCATGPWRERHALSTGGGPSVLPDTRQASRGWSCRAELRTCQLRVRRLRRHSEIQHEIISLSFVLIREKAIPFNKCKIIFHVTNTVEVEYLLKLEKHIYSDRNAIICSTPSLSLPTSRSG